MVYTAFFFCFLVVENLDHFEVRLIPRARVNLLIRTPVKSTGVAHWS